MSDSRTEDENKEHGAAATGTAEPPALHSIVRHLQGDPHAFSELIERYQAQVYSYLIRCGINVASRDDMFQEIFLRVHTSAKQYQPERPFEPWLFTIVANTTRSFFRKQRVRALIGAAGDNDESINHTTAEHLAQAKETTLWLEDRLRTLPLAQREVLALCCFKSLSQTDVAAVLGIPLSTVKTHLHRGRAALAKALAQRQLQSKKEAA